MCWAHYTNTSLLFLSTHTFTHLFSSRRTQSEFLELPLFLLMQQQKQQQITNWLFLFSHYCLKKPILTLFHLPLFSFLLLGHRYGPQSKMTKQAVRDIDEILYDLQDMLTKKDLDDEVNLYVLSDHGMIDTRRFREIHLETVIDFNDVELALGAGSTMQLLAERGKHVEVKLGCFQVS